MSDIESNYNYQVTTGGRGYGKTFFENRIRQAYKSGIDVGFIEKHRLIKYLEDKINEPRIGDCDCLTDKMFETEKRVYQDILEKVKSGKYE